MSRLPLHLLAIVLLLSSCSRPQVPSHYEQAQAPPIIYPDYADVTIPVNMAPLNMELLIAADDAVTRFSAGDYELLCGGLKARPDLQAWKRLTAKARNSHISVEIFARNGDRWVRFKPFSIYVSGDSIEAWLCYRLISPSFVSYEELTINQRCLEDFTESVIVDNMLCSTETGGQCVNCHSFQHHNPNRMQFHARQSHGGTVIAYDGQTEKISMVHDSLLSAGVYPAWHPTEKLIVYSTNTTMQSFHTAHPNKIEVIDGESDLILYDPDRHEAATIQQVPGELETFPCWAADGRSLYFCSAHFEYEGGKADAEEITLRAQEVRYNIYKMDFDPLTRRFGPRLPVFVADTLGLSATLPRTSPDGRWLMFTMGQWGNFHIWHHDADLWLMDLHTGKARPLEECNSDDTESYHSWSASGRWVVFSSRRYDGMFTRPFFAHLEPDGTFTKPFELPAADPDLHRQMLKSYNVPEFMSGPVSLKPQQLAGVLKGEGTPINYQPRQP